MKKWRVLYEETGIQPKMNIAIIEKVMAQNQMVRMDARELILNTVRLCDFAVIIRLLLGYLL